MNSRQQHTKPRSPAVRHLLLLAMLFAVGFGCFKCFRFTIPLLNSIFAVGVLSIPFFALRAISHLPRIPKVIGFVLISPLMPLSLLMVFAIMLSAACDLHPLNKGCMQELGRIERDGYSVHLILEDCGGAIGSRYLSVAQRRPVLPGLYLFRSVDLFDGPYEGRMTSVSPNEIRLQIPRGVEGSYWKQEIDRTYTLKRYVYF